MRSSFATLALVALAAAEPIPQAVTSAIAPKSSAPAGCSSSYSGTFEIEVVNATSSSKKRDASSDTTLTISLSNGILTDADGRTGYVASNNQFQFDKPPQAGAIYTAGFSVCANGSLAIGGDTMWYKCLSGTFYNLYDDNDSAQCSPIYIQVIGGGSSGSSATASAAASQLPDGQPTASPVCQITDGQPQATSCAGAVGQTSDGQPQATSVGAVGQTSDGQPQATTAGAVGQTSDGQPQATTAGAVGQTSDGQPQATTAGAVGQTSDGQPQATTAGAVGQTSDGQVQATSAAAAGETSDGQVQATSAAAVGQTSDGQVQATSAAAASASASPSVEASTGGAAALHVQVAGLFAGVLAVAML